jgi:hypothetical protein
LRRHGLHFEVQLIYGLPDETRASFRRSLNDALALDPPELTVFRLMVLPGTALWHKAADLELTFDPEPPYHVRSHRTMTHDDVEYGRRLVKGANLLQGSRTVRLLAREPGVTFADLVDDWIVWQERRGLREADGGGLKAFVADVCARRALPIAFYKGFAEWEFRAAE